MRVNVKCDWCGKEYERLECQLKGKQHHFCSRGCLAAFSNKSKNPEGYAKLKDYTNISAHMSELNVEMNPDRMTPEVRAKLRACRMTEGNGRTYAKVYGKKEHRVVAEKVIGRPLLPNEVVHHIDCNRRNNDPNNLMVLTASEHASIHGRMRGLWSNKRFTEGDNA